MQQKSYFKWKKHQHYAQGSHSFANQKIYDFPVAL